VTPHLVDPLTCDQLPKYLPGEETRSPDDFELFLEGILEAPRGPRQVFKDGRYVPAYKNSPSAEQFPCAGNGYGPGGNGAGCGAGCAGCAAPAGPAPVAPAGPPVAAAPPAPATPPAALMPAADAAPPAAESADAAKAPAVPPPALPPAGEK
jgi:pilus assembly protein CpaC